jgi:hypothetical protein
MIIEAHYHHIIYYLHVIIAILSLIIDELARSVEEALHKLLLLVRSCSVCNYDPKLFILFTK